MRYRPEINGLRAIAVLAVVFLHSGFEVFSGGFIGVDVFFVISGYLITTILINDMETNQFSILTFYERRARRIFPALFFMILLCLPLGWMFLEFDQAKDFYQSIVAISLFASNILFWQETDYFALSALEKPLLHTWSLSVEEQFYLIFPFCFLLSWRWGIKSILWLIFVIVLISLIICEWGWRNHSIANFYLLPTRAWEILCGTISALIIYKNGIIKNNTISLLGLILILISIFTFDKATPYPSVYTLLPVMGTFLIIIFANEDTFVANFLSLKLLVGLGLISYSIYLWHYPLFAFAYTTSIDTPSASLMIVLMLSTLAIAYFSWHFIEQPFRRIHIQSKVILTTVLLSISIFLGIGIFGSLYANILASGKMNPLNVELNIGNYNSNNRNLQLESWEPLKKLSEDQSYYVDNNSFDNKDWFEIDDNRPRILLVGNSHSKDLYNVLINSSQITKKFALTRYGAQIRSLSKSHRFWDSPNYLKSDLIIISSKYNFDDIKNLNSIIERVKNDNKTILIVKNIFEFSEYRAGKWGLIDKIIYENYPSLKSPKDMYELVNREYFRHYMSGLTSNEVILINKKIHLLSKQHNIQLLDRMDYVCDNDKLTCYAVNDDLEKFFYDYGHHTIEGGIFYGQRVDDINWLRFNN